MIQWLAKMLDILRRCEDDRAEHLAVRVRLAAAQRRRDRWDA